MSEPPITYDFGPFRLDAGQRLLLRDGELVALTPKALETLLVLVAANGRMLTKDELLNRLWPDTVVEEANLTQNVFVVRKALGDGKDGARYIETLPRRGYRFVAPVVCTAAGGEDAAATQVAPPSPAGPKPPHRRAAVGAQALLVLAMVTAAMLAPRWRRSQEPAPADSSAPTLPTLAVLPFKPLGEGTDAVLELGMADALITRLSNLRGISVRPTSSVVRFAGREVDPIVAGGELGVDSLLDGRVQRLGGRLRLTVQLLSATDGRPLWGGTFDQDFADLFDVQDSISRQVASALVAILSDEERSRLERHPTADMEAYRLYLEGVYHAVLLANFDQAIEALEGAIALDPGFAQAYSGLAYAYSQTVDLMLPPREAQPRARRAAVEALGLDPRDANARWILAHVLFQYDWNAAGAEEQFRQALALRPDDVRIRGYFSFMLAVLGRFDEALTEAERALETDPWGFEAYLFAGYAHYFRREYDLAEARWRQLVELEPSFWLAHVSLGRALEQQGRLHEAITEYRLGRDLDRSTTEPWMDLGRALGLAGRREESRQLLDELLEKREQRYVAPYHVAMAYLGLGDRDRTFAWLERAFRDRSWYLSWLAVAPELDPLRDDSRFADLMRRVGLFDRSSS